MFRVMWLPVVSGLSTLIGMLALSAARDQGGRMAFSLSSAAFKEGATIPGKYTCDGADVSPSLGWSGAPPGTVAFALIADDPDAPAGTWVHWVLYDLPAAAAQLSENVEKSDAPASLGGARQGRTDF